MGSARSDTPVGTEELDVVIVGAGISGVAMARQIQVDHPGLSYAVLEARVRVGGTWDLFRYPGLRSDSGMDTFAYSFRPWPGDRHFGGGEEIRSYVEATAAEYGIDRQIRFGCRVTEADWDSTTARWAVTGTGPDGEFRISCRFLIGCTGYFRYDRGYSPELAGEEDFEGELFHAQDWPDNLPLNGRRVTVIGSGATAITVVPALATAGAEVTMLQRSPSYVVTVPDESAFARRLKRHLPSRCSGGLLRWLGVFTEIAQFQIARRFPNLTRRLIITAARRQLPAAIDRRHLIPRYDPWTQRVCFSPDGDLFTALSDGRARIETGEIERIESDRIRLRDGTLIPAEVIVKATGLDLLLFGEIEVSIDGEPVDPADRLVYRGAMLSGIPNFVFVVGYTNASWTLKAELIARFASRLVATVRKQGAASATPIAPDGPMETVPLLNLDSGYIRRAESRLPKAGDRSPWVLHMNYLADRRELLRGNLEDDSIRYG
ncbi:MAG: NAD(P)/FAD-dependent oxidoreductase [Solirubrobacterales bacterium]|nr:NAD(P)/FAD-dependent oxidoreductase [Solirubrobacterales bacterium]